MAKVRLGVVLLLPPPAATEVDGLRRALGDGALERIPAHLTLVPPVNVNTKRLAEAFSLLRSAAEKTKPFTVSFGAPVSFLPDSPTIYLPVTEGDEQIRILRDRVFLEPLARDVMWPFVPHVTLADEAEPERISSAIETLADYRLEIRFERLHLLAEDVGRVWEPIADAAFRPLAVIGRGGLPVELSVTELLDPEVAGVAGIDPMDLPGDQVVIAARRDGSVIGALLGWTSPGAAMISQLRTIEEVKGEGVEAHLRAAFASVIAERGLRGEKP